MGKLREECWGAVEEVTAMGSDAAEGRMGVEEVVSEAAGSWVESLEEVSGAEEGCSGAESDSEILSAGG